MIIAISHQKGGVGKSTIAWNLAISLQKKYTVELVDLDTQKTLTYTNEIRKQQTKYGPLNIRTFKDAEELKRYINNDSDDKLSIIDLGGFDSTMNRITIITADLVITPVSDKSFELLGLKSFEGILSQLSELIKGEIKVKVLLNNINPQKSKLNKLKTFIEKSSHFELLDTVLRTRVDYDKSAGAGKSVIEYKEDSKAASEIKALVKEVRKILNT
jgi:chromosome partitioning protein